MLEEASASFTSIERVYHMISIYFEASALHTNQRLKFWVRSIFAGIKQQNSKPIPSSPTGSESAQKTNDMYLETLGVPNEVTIRTKRRRASFSSANDQAFRLICKVINKSKGMSLRCMPLAIESC